MSSLAFLTPWRQALQAFLEEAFPDAEVIGGMRSGVSADKDRICIFHPIWREDGDPNYARPNLEVRFWPARSRQPTDNPADPTAIEQAIDDMLSALQTVQAPGKLIDGLYCRCIAAVPDYDPNEWGIRFTLTAWTVNPATIAPASV